MTEVAVSVHQPNFMPWLKLLDKILASDVYVAYDTVQYTRSEYHSRQRILTPNGPAWLSVPLLSVKGRNQLIEQVRIDPDQPFRSRHLKLLRVGYAKARFFDEVYGLVEDVYGRDQARLVDLSLDLIEALCRYLGSEVRIERASRLPHTGDNTERLVQLVRAVGGTVHLTSTFGTGRRYVDWERMQAAGIRIRSQDFDHPRYEQRLPGFVPHLAAVDMLFACGPATRQILADRRRFDDVEAGLERVDSG
jgi:WbqC-like protein